MGHNKRPLMGGRPGTGVASSKACRAHEGDYYGPCSWAYMRYGSMPDMRFKIKYFWRGMLLHKDLPSALVRDMILT